jgi:formylmethanofuran:tetrahydromethanopterin formyltransferase
MAEESVELTTEALAGLSQSILERMRQAVITADLDQLLATIQEVEEGDPRIARGLRSLAEGFQYEKLLNLLPVKDAH